MKIFVIVSRNNKFMWPKAYTTQKEAELICEYLAKKFELSAPYYWMEVVVGREEAVKALAQKAVA